VLFDGRFRFDNFIVGSANRLAVAAARAVAEAPGTVYNPLFVYSGSGLGKTHLMGAVGHAARQRQPQLRIEYLSLDELVEQLHAAISTGQVEPFRHRYHEVELLLLDDVQFLTGHRETQTELLRLFNVLQGSGRQIVMTSDRPPSEIPDVDERLVTRLSGGLIVDIGPPDYETRVAILRAKSEDRKASFTTGVLEELARVEFANVRELQGALNRLIAQQQVGTVGLKEVQAIVGDRVMASRPAMRPTPTTGMEFSSFLSDIAGAVAQVVEPWKQRLAEAIMHFGSQGYRVAVLERALQLPRDPGVDRLLETFTGAIDHLRDIEAQVTAIDTVAGGHDAFRDPERVDEAEEMLERALAGQTPPPGPNTALSRATYETGASNQLAVKAADAVVEAPGERYNPLFLCGPSGVGKTHLANAIGNELAARSGGAFSVACVNTQAFIDELIAALQEGTIERWRARYRAADALILDDVHFVASKERTQEELFHVFNALYASGKQIVLVADKPPRDLADLEARLRSRFEGGLVVEMGAPDRALREKLYARFLSAEEPAPEAALYAYLAERPVESVREIAGLVNRLRMAADVENVTISLALAKREFEGAGVQPVAAPTPTSAPQGVDAFFLDDEKVVWDWPDVTGRVVEELR
jgi:chromosomal replication initiation ATPase DnaA